jgi:hypothetical protein
MLTGVVRLLTNVAYDFVNPRRSTLSDTGNNHRLSVRDCHNAVNVSSVVYNWSYSINTKSLKMSIREYKTISRRKL